MYLVLFSGQKYQTYRGGWEGSVWLQDIFSLFCVLCIIIVAVYQPQLWSTHCRARARACVFLKYMSCGVNHAYTVLLWGPQILWGNILLQPTRLRSFSYSLTRDSCSPTNLKNIPLEECATFTKRTHVRVRWCVRLCAL